MTIDNDGDDDGGGDSDEVSPVWRHTFERQWSSDDCRLPR